MVRGGFKINRKRVWRLWKREDFKAPRKHVKSVVSVNNPTTSCRGGQVSVPASTVDEDSTCTPAARDRPPCTGERPADCDAATWLHTYGDMIAKHRLKRLIQDELEPEARPILGLLLDTAQQGTHPLAFETVIKQLEPAKESMPQPMNSHPYDARLKTILPQVARLHHQLRPQWAWSFVLELGVDLNVPATCHLE